MTTLDSVAEKIIKEQELVIGPLAWSEAQKVQGLQVDSAKGAVVLAGANPKEAIDRLVAQYERLFGRASHEVCREAAAPLLVGLSPTDIPTSLLAA